VRGIRRAMGTLYAPAGEREAAVWARQGPLDAGAPRCRAHVHTRGRRRRRAPRPSDAGGRRYCMAAASCRRGLAGCGWRQRQPRARSSVTVTVTTGGRVVRSKQVRRGRPCATYDDDGSPMASAPANDAEMGDVDVIGLEARRRRLCRCAQQRLSAGGATCNCCVCVRSRTVACGTCRFGSRPDVHPGG
jgi:hypothetical protein